MADEEVEEHGPVALFRNSSMDDLRFELKRLQQKYDVLERDKKIMEDEIKLSAKTASDGVAIDQLSREIKLKNAELLKWYESASALGQKHRVVLRHLWLEKRALLEMKTELSRGLDAMFSSPDIISALKRIQDGLHIARSERDELVIASVQHKGKEAALRKRIHGVDSAVKMQKSSFESLKTTIYGELRDWKIFVDTCNKELKSEVLRSSHGSAAMMQSMHQLRAERDELSRNYKTMQIDYGIQIKAVSDLQTEMMIASERFNAISSNLNNKIVDLSTSLENSYSEKKNLASENIRLSSELELGMDQLRRLASVHTALQGELQLAEERENGVRAELATHGSSKAEISSRLKRIQEKVNQMEAQHSEQMKELQSHLEMSREALHRAVLDKETAQRLVGDAAREAELMREKAVDEWKLRYRNLEEKINMTVVNERNIKLRIAEQESLITLLRSKLAEVELREEESNTSQNDMKLQLENKDFLICEAERASLELRGDLMRVEQKLIDQSTKAEVMQKELTDATAENARLLMVVQKECKERTELLIQISELKDVIRDGPMTILQGGGSVHKSGSSAYSHLSAISGLSQDNINSGLITSHNESPCISDKRLSEAINYSRGVENGDPASGADNAWAERIGKPGGRGRKSTRGASRR